MCTHPVPCPHLAFVEGEPLPCCSVWPYAQCPHAEVPQHRIDDGEPIFHLFSYIVMSLSFPFFCPSFCLSCFLSFPVSFYLFSSLSFIVSVIFSLTSFCFSFSFLLSFSLSFCLCFPTLCAFLSFFVSFFLLLPPLCPNLLSQSVPIYSFFHSFTVALPVSQLFTIFIHHHLSEVVSILFFFGLFSFPFLFPHVTCPFTLFGLLLHACIHMHRQ